MPTEKSYGTFIKDGRTRVAQSPGEAVTMRYTGWAEQAPAAFATGGVLPSGVTTVENATGSDEVVSEGGHPAPSDTAPTDPLTPPASPRRRS